MKILAQNTFRIFSQSLLMLIFLTTTLYANKGERLWNYIMAGKNMDAIDPWRVTEYFGLDWPEQAVHVKLDKKTAAMMAVSGEPIYVVDQTGRSVPGQLVPKANPNQVWYLASLRPKETKTYHFARGDRSSHRSLTLVVRGDVAEIANDSFAAQLSWSDDVSYSPSRPLEMLDGPIQALRGLDGVWYGKGSWEGKVRCRAFRCRIIEEGPVLLVVQQTYLLDSGDELTFEYRLDAATPGVTVTLNSDVSVEAVAKWDIFERGGFEPSHAFWRAHSSDKWRGVKDPENWYRQVYALRWPETPDEVKLRPFYYWDRNGTSFWSCWSEQNKRRDMLLIGAIRPSRTMAPGGFQPYTIRTIRESGENRLTLSMPSQKGRKLFFLGMIDRRDALPKLYAPKSKIEDLYRQIQCLSLDDYHHLNVAWDGMDMIRFPHLMIDPDDVEEIRKTFREWTWLKEGIETYLQDEPFYSSGSTEPHTRPDGFNHANDWSGAYLATGGLEYAHEAKQQIGEQLDRWVEQLAGVGPTVDPLIGIVFARRWRSIVISFDLVASSDAFTQAERTEYLRKFAFIAEVTSTQDAWPAREAGIGLGPANFHADYISGKGIGAALLTGHPRQREWMDYAIREASQYMRSYHFADGVAKEASTYQLVSLNYMLLLATAVRNEGGDDLFFTEPMMKKSFDYLASTQTPRDPRTGFCMLPTVGHVTTYGWCQSLQAYFAWAAKATATSDPAFSKRMMAAWKRAGAIPISLHDFANGMGWWQPLCFIDRTLPAKPDPSYGQSKLYQGMGAIFRAAHKSGEEGYLLVKMGQSRGHYDADEGSLIWYAYGKPLLVDFGTQYNPNIECAWLHNRISFDHWNNSSNNFFRITEHKLGEYMDYLSGEITVSRLGRWDEWPIRDPNYDHHLATPPRTIDPVKWRRRVLYIHQCEAVVIMDELNGAEPTDWNLQVLANEVQLEKRSAHFKGQFGVDLDVYFANPSDPEIRISSFEHLGFDEPRIGFPWWQSMRWAAPEGTSFGPLGERALTLRTKAASHPKYLTLLYARPTDQPIPDVTVLPDATGFKWKDYHGSWSVRLNTDDTWSLLLNGERME